MDAALQRIKAVNPALNAFLDIDEAGARAAAQASLARRRAGTTLSPLDGVTIGIKANFAVQGLPWHGGIAAYRNRIAAQDAPCVAALRAAGAVVLGVLNMHEAGLGGSSDNPFFGAVRNPRWPGLSPGGSSGGGASAVAAGLCDAALGTDTLGSIRIPAAYCGVFGHKPSAGLIAASGVMPLSWTLDSVGVQAASSGLCAEVLAVLAPGATLPDKDAPICGVLEAALEPATAATIPRARALGVTVTALRLPGYDFAAMRRLGLMVAEMEAEITHRQRLAACPDGFSDDLRRMLAWGAAQPPARLVAAYRQITEAAARIKDALAGIDVLLLPTTPQPPFAFGQSPPADQADFTAFANIAGLAATAFPVGVSSVGAPVSIQAVSVSDLMSLRIAGMLSIGPGHQFGDASEAAYQQSKPSSQAEEQP